MRQFNHRHLRQAQLVRGSEPTVASDDAVVAIHQYRICPTVLDDACGDLGHLLVVVRSRIPGVGDQRLDLAVLDVEHIQFVSLKKKRPGRVRREPRRGPRASLLR